MDEPALVVESVRRVHTAIRDRARLSGQEARRVQECLMLERLPLGAVIALSFISALATAAQPPLEMRDLLSIGVDAPDAGLKWGASRRQIRHRYPELIEHPAFLGFLLQVRVSAQGCTFTVYLSGSRTSDRLEQIWIVHRNGPLAQCRSQLESALAALYGRASTVTTPATQNEGEATLSDWRSATTCVNLKWEEQGVEHGVSPLEVKLGDLQGGCGYSDQVVPTEPRGAR